MITANVDGLDKLLGNFTNLGVEGIRMADAVIASNVDGMVLEAKQSAPADLGKIRQSLGKEKVSEDNTVGYNFFCNALEAGFQEFGTGGKVDVPSEMADIASTFQGYKGGSMQEFILALIGWVRRHGLTGVYSIKTHKRIGTNASNLDADTQAAWAIARSILRNGLKPQPFFYPAFVNGRSKLMPALEAAYNQLIQSNNGKP